MKNEDGMKRGAIAWMVNNAVAPNILMLVCLIGGTIVWVNMTREVFPNRQEDLISVNVPYPGASPEEVEQGVVLAVEAGVRTLDGVLEVTSTSREGMGMVVVEALPGADLDALAQNIKSEVDRIRTMPEDAEEPVIEVMARRREVLELQVYGNVPETVLHLAAEEVRDEFLQDPNITQVELGGEKPLEISVEVSQENLRRYGLTLDEIAARLRQASIELPAGGIKTEQGEVLVRMKERRDFGRQFARTPIILTEDGTEVLLEDIANINDGFADVDMIGRYNGVPSIGVNVFRVGDQTPIDVSSAVMERIALLKTRLPEAIDIAVVDDDAEIYRQRMDLLLQNGMVGGLLVVVLLGIFLEARLAFWVMLGVPVSFLGGILFLPSLGVSLNMVSMFAFILSLGILVDDAIVVGENVYYHHEQGMPFRKAAIHGTRELAMPVFFSVLTNIAAFAPIIFVPGTIGKMFWMMPAVSITVFTVSLIESIFILPAHLGHASEKPRKGIGKVLHGAQQAFSKGFTRAVNGLFQPALDFLVGHRYVSMSVAFSILIVALSWPLSMRMGFSLFPTIESDTARATIIMPFGHPVKDTEAISQRIYKGALEVVQQSGHPELMKGVRTLIGENGSHTAAIEVELAPSEIRDTIMSAEEFVERWRTAVGPVFGTESLTYSAESIGGRRGADLDIELSHRDVNVLEKACGDLAEALAGFPIVKDIDDGFEEGKSQIDFKIKPEGLSLGLTAQQVARQVRSAFYGAEVLRQQRGRNEIKVMVRLPENQRVSEFNLEQMILLTSRGVEVPLHEVVEAKRGNAFTQINRRDGRRIIEVTANVNPRSEAPTIIAALKENELPSLQAKYPGLSYGFEGRQADMEESMANLRVGFVIALCVVFALLAIAFQSYTQPLIVMTSIPFGVLGAILGHLIMGYTLSMISIFGIVALSGVVVNGALVLIHSALIRCNNGASPREAVVAAATQRFRPIMLTTLTTFCGLAPIIFENSRQARFLIPMAISLGFGVLFSTLVTLIVVPCLFVILDDIKRALAFLRHPVSTLQEKAAEAEG